MYEKIIGIIGTPRSGTSWTGQIFDSAPDTLYRMQPFYSYAFRDKLHVRSSRAEINRFFDDLYNSKDEYLAQKQRRQSRVYATFGDKNLNAPFMVYKEVFFHYLVPALLSGCDKLEILALVRHPVDVLTSYYNAPREFRPGLDIQKEWYFAQDRNEALPERYFGYFKWKEYMNLIDYISTKFSDKVSVIKYEDLYYAPEYTVEKIFSRYGIILTEQTKKFLEDSQNRTGDDPYSVFRDRKNPPLKKKLPDNIIEAVHKDLDTFDIANKFGYR